MVMLKFVYLPKFVLWDVCMERKCNALLAKPSLVVAKVACRAKETFLHVLSFISFFPEWECQCRYQSVCGDSCWSCHVPPQWTELWWIKMVKHPDTGNILNRGIISWRLIVLDSTSDEFKFSLHRILGKKTWWSSEDQQVKAHPWVWFPEWCCRTTWWHW